MANTVELSPIWRFLPFDLVQEILDHFTDHIIASYDYNDDPSHEQYRDPGFTRQLYQHWKTFRQDSLFEFQRQRTHEPHGNFNMEPTPIIEYHRQPNTLLEIPTSSSEEPFKLQLFNPKYREGDRDEGFYPAIDPNKWTNYPWEADRNFKELVVRIKGLSGLLKWERIDKLSDWVYQRLKP